jgi:hypothetical protein
MSKRTKRGRHLSAAVTDEAVVHFREALARQDQYIGCMRGEVLCPRQTRCQSCAEYLEHVRRSAAELRRKPWEADPLIDEIPLRDELLRRLHG